MPIVVDTAATVAALGGFEAKLIGGGAVAVHEGAKAIQAEAERNLRMHGSHSRGTPTPSAPGSPPAMIDEKLAGSITPNGIVANGLEVYEEVGPAGIPYARVQEMGGQVHNHELKARPYLKPALARVRGDLTIMFARAWGGV